MKIEEQISNISTYVQLGFSLSILTAVVYLTLWELCSHARDQEHEVSGS